ncbi:nicotinamide mononucleotide transporter [Deefgea piscis]|uniref:Nicotinamide riboside transporter PnuC n=1 Tax=Deefgea piscis TaxID=2739061 RepID=A0A6M8SR52_9NEIS|nr:nicotinamide riboside transporter PnuC [Deefgea piscis]QKJ67675.1 nicotinamide mononucleotide transporter [Deefgea piscis]
MSSIEIIGFVISLLAIYLATRQHRFTWPLQIIASLLYVYLFLNAHLYGESLLQLVYAGIAAYGFYHWRNQTQNDDVKIERLSRKEWLYINAAGIVLLLLVAQFQVQFLPTDVPYLDSSVFIFGLIAQWMQARKKIENWIYWIVLDLISAGIYWYKDLQLTAVLYLILTVLALTGWLTWRKKLR